MSLEPGRRLAQYRLEAKIGEGGMGEVWKATDTTLDRPVAIKILPEIFSEDPERLARFEREAKLLASLNHPSIAVIHGLHRTEGINFLAMELVEGEDLARRIERGALPADEAVAIGRQVAEALEAAHESGVIHRDLKPANIQITPEGRVKVLDFGLAKAFETDTRSGNPSMSPTLTSAGTRAGMILGTAAYMSPEQARGRTIDRRTDVWGFGCVLFEMITGESPFAGETITDTLAAVVRAEPDWPRLAGRAPERVIRLLRRCLVKDPKERLRDIGEARIALAAGLEADPPPEPAGATGPVSGLTAAAASKRRVLVGLLWVATLVAAGLAARMIGSSDGGVDSNRPLRKFEIQAVEGPEKTKISVSPRISPDGRRIAYGAGGRLWVRELSRLEPRDLGPTQKGGILFWSPDSAWIGRLSGNGITKLPVAGGEATTLCSLSGTFSDVAGGAWLPDRRIVFTTGAAGLMEVSDQGGDPREILKPLEDESDFHYVTPLGRTGVLGVAHRKMHGPDRLFVFDGKNRKTVLTVEGQWLGFPAYSPSGHLLFYRQGSNSGVWAVPFSPARMEVTGSPFLVAPESRDPSVAGDGTLAYIRGGRTAPSQLLLVDRTGKEIRRLGEPRSQDGFPRFSPDGTRIVEAEFEGGNKDLWVHDIARNTRTRWTFAGESESAPAWSPRGDRLAYVVGEGFSSARIFEKTTDGTGSERSVVEPPALFPEFSPDGKWLLFVRRSEVASLDIFRVDGEGKGEPARIVANKGVDVYPAVSPDGRLLAYQSDESGRDEVYLTRFPEGEGKWQVSASGGSWPRWSRSGRHLYFLAEDTMMEVSVDPGPTPVLGEPVKLFTRESVTVFLPFGWGAGFDVSGEGERFAITQDVAQDRPAAIAVIEEWSDEFEKGQP